MESVGHIGELGGVVIAAVVSTLGALQAWLKIQQKRNGGRNPHDTTTPFGRSSLKAMLLEQEKELSKLIGSEGDETRRQFREEMKQLRTDVGTGLSEIERAIRERGGQV